MGRVIDLEAWRRDGGPHERPDAVGRLERAVDRLQASVGRLTAGTGRVDGDIETELLAITGAVSIGLIHDAAERAEQLLGRLGGRGARRTT